MRELNSTLTSDIEKKPQEKKRILHLFQKMFPNKPIKWNEIYLLSRKVRDNTYL